MGCVLNKTQNQEVHQREILEHATFEDCADIIYDFNSAKVLDIYDGDTITVAAWYNGLIRKFNVRLFGIDCPEIKASRCIESVEEKDTRVLAALKAKNYLRANIQEKIIKIRVLNNTKMNESNLTDFWYKFLVNKNLKDNFYKNIKDGRKFREKWGRLLADVWFTDEKGYEKHLVSEMLRLGLGKPYFGGTKS